MTIDEMQEIKAFARSLGYVISEGSNLWSNDKMFTVLYPNTYSEYNTILDFTFSNLDAVDLTNHSARKLMTEEVDCLDVNTFDLKTLDNEEVKQFLIYKWEEYKRYFTTIKLNNIESDFN